MAALYAKEIRVLTYYKIDLAILWFVNTIDYYRKIILACFIYTKAFWQIKHPYYCNNYIYKHVPLGNTPAFEF